MGDGEGALIAVTVDIGEGDFAGFLGVDTLAVVALGHICGGTGFDAGTAGGNLADDVREIAIDEETEESDGDNGDSESEDELFAAPKAFFGTDDFGHLLLDEGGLFGAEVLHGGEGTLHGLLLELSSVELLGRSRSGGAAGIDRSLDWVGGGFFGGSWTLFGGCGGFLLDGEEVFAIELSG